MNYPRIYALLIGHATTRDKPVGYVERHHIIPRSLGGSDDASNLVYLTGREHYIAHVLLAKIHGGKMWCALNLMKNAYVIKTSRMYQVIRSKNAEYLSTVMKGNTYSKGNIVSEETRRKTSEAHKGKPKNQNHRNKIAAALRGKILPLEHRNKIAAAHIGKKSTIETRIKLSKIHTGRKRSIETKIAISKSLKGRIFTQETRLKLSMAAKNRKNKT